MSGGPDPAGDRIDDLMVALERRIGYLSEFAGRPGDRIPHQQKLIADDLDRPDRETCVDAAARTILIASYLYEPALRAAVCADALHGVRDRLQAAASLPADELRRRCLTARRALADALNALRTSESLGGMNRAAHNTTARHAHQAASELATCSLAYAGHL